jgi:CheY-like chemotaxis protein
MKKSILLIEDEVDALALLEMYFELQGFDVLCARDGEEAWELLEHRRRPSVILSDYLMPGMNGIELCEKLKESPPYADIPFVLMTGTPHLPDCALPDAVYRKPMRLEKLLRDMERLMEDRGTPSQPTIQ